MMKHLKQLNGIRGLLPYLKTKRPTVLLIFFLSVIDAGLSLLPIQIIAAVVDLLSTGHSVFSPILGTSLTLHLVFFGAVYAAKHALSLIYGYTNTMLSTGIIESLRDDAMTWALESYKPYKEERREGDIVSRISGDVEAVVRAVAGPLNGLLPMVLKMIGSVVMMFVWSPVLGAISLALVLPLYAASKRVAVKSKEIAAELLGLPMVIPAEQRAASGRLVGAVGDLLYCIPIIKAWGSERFEAAGFHAFSHQMYTLNRKSQRIFNVYWGITYTLMTIGYLSAVVFSARSALAGAATAGSIAVAYSYMSNILTPAASISRYGNDIFQADAALARVFELKPAAASPAAPYALHDAPAVEFDHVTISCSEHKQLQDLCFTAAPHQLVVLAGESGSGKSTILNALLGNQPTMGGRILVDHADVTGQLDRLRSSVSVAFQASYLFDRSIADNVAYASDAPDGQRIEDALRASGLDGLVRERGADFTVGSKGKFLSGGEQRRVALSRALYKNAPLYLLDEPTSELDPETSRVVIEQILRLKQSATIIAASHDATLIEKADVVVTL